MRGHHRHIPNNKYQQRLPPFFPPRRRPQVSRTNAMCAASSCTEYKKLKLKLTEPTSYLTHPIKYESHSVPHYPVSHGTRQPSTMQALQMQQMRVARAPQVAVPPVSAAPLQISRDLRQQLRVTRHRAFERLQENAQWTRQLLDGATTAEHAPVTPSGLASTPEELQQQIDAAKQAVEQQEQRLKLQTEEKEATQRRFEEMLATLKTATDAAALKSCEEKLQAEKALLLPKKPRKMEVLKL
ncbi:unnamed protein product [Phytophthora lilii]|uniref:Unnamed protein product n=1 Tax=Phytophthora lilii TaxID=2077276 RepID=A0A9W6TN97_9STRA|nr:unnamed protein product [Phytophthora lilii]